MYNKLNNLIDKITNKPNKDIDKIIIQYIKQNNIQIHNNTLIINDKNINHNIKKINNVFNINLLKRFKIHTITNHSNSIKAKTNRKYKITHIQDKQSNFIRSVNLKYNKRNNLIEYSDNYLNYKYKFKYLEDLLCVAEYYINSELIRKLSGLEDDIDRKKICIINEIIQNETILSDHLFDTGYLLDYLKQN